MRLLNEYSFTSAGRKGTYDWPTLLDGGIRELTKGEDFHCKPESFRNGARQAATAHGKGVKTAVVGDTVILQGFDQEPTPEPAE